MDSVSYPTSGALNRAHYALVAKIENASSSFEVESVILGVINETRHRILSGSGSGFGRLEELARNWGVHLPTAAAWDPAKAREDLLLLLYCKTAGRSKRIKTKQFEFAIPHALTLAEGGRTIAQRRAGYLYCISVIPSGHEMQLMLVNTLRKDLESTSMPRVVLSLDIILASPTEAVIPAITNRLEDLLAHSSACVRQRALLGFATLAVYDRELLTRCIDKLPHRLQDPDISVRAATLDLLFVCFQNGYVDAGEVLDVATAILKGGSQRKIRERRKGGELLMKALAILESPLENLLRDGAASEEAKIQDLVETIITIGQVACEHKIWRHLLSALRVFGKFPIDILIHHLASRSNTTPTSVHPLAFIQPMIHEKDPNVLYTLLSVLRCLPTAIWTGTAPESDLIGKSMGLPETLETLEPLQPTLAPLTSPTADDPFHDVFGPFERGSTSHSPDYVTPSGSLGLSNVNTSPKAASQMPHLPPLFDEEEVGTIVGFLRSEDSTLRKGTLRLLFSVDSSEGGAIRQYLGSLLEGIAKVAQGQAKGGNTAYGQLKILTCRAMEAADVLAAGNGATYASETDRVLLEAEAGEITEEGGRSSSKATVLDEVVEMVLVRLQDGTAAFQQTFTDGVLRNLVAYPKEVASRSTLVTLCAAVACQYGSSDVQLDQQVVNALGQTLTQSPTSIQEVMLLAMLRTIARDGVSAEPVLPEVQELRTSSGRHISKRCAQFLDLASDLPCLRKLVATVPLSTLPDFLGIIEVHFHARKKEQYAASKSVRSTSAGSSPQTQVKKNPTVLRYTAYDTPPPTSARRSKPKRQDSFNSLESYTSAPQWVSNFPVVKNNWQTLSPDMVDLAQSVAGGSSRSVSPVVRRQDSVHSLSPPNAPHKDLMALESPFHDELDKGMPPFATKSRSPSYKSTPLSPGFTPPKLKTRSPLQRSTHLPTLSASGSLSGLQNSGIKAVPTHRRDESGRFDALWNQIGSSNKSGVKGWSEKGVGDTLGAARGIPDIDIVVKSDTGVEVRAQLQLGLNIGLLKLRKDEDGGCVWSLRSTDETLRRLVKAELD